MIRGNRDKCYYCGQTERCTKEHFYPKSKGGRYIVWACGICQGSKKNMLPLDWLLYIQNHLAIKDEIKIRISTAVLSLDKILKTKHETI